MSNDISAREFGELVAQMRALVEENRRLVERQDRANGWRNDISHKVSTVETSEAVVATKVDDLRRGFWWLLALFGSLLMTVLGTLAKQLFGGP